VITASEAAALVAIFQVQHGLALCPLHSESSVILVLSTLTGQADMLCMHTAHGTLCYTPPTYINHCPTGFEAEVFTGQMPFLSPNQQRQSTARRAALKA